MRFKKISQAKPWYFQHVIIECWPSPSEVKSKIHYSIYENSLSYCFFALCSVLCDAMLVFMAFNKAECGRLCSLATEELKGQKDFSDMLRSR